MRARFTFLITLFLLAIVHPLSAQTTFTYQGRLADAGVPANGSFDFEFRLWDAVGGGNLLGTVPADALLVEDGEFSARLDFGTGPFDGSARWLELAVRPAGNGAFTTLAPRQPIDPTPYALHSDQATNALVADGALFADVAATASSVQYQNVIGAPVRQEALCVQADGSPGVVIGGVCLLSFDSRSSSSWPTAATACANIGGDLCSTSQYATLRLDRPDLFAPDRAVWSNDFSDNDGGSKSFELRSSDDPSFSQLYSYGCCRTVTETVVRAQTNVVGGVPVSFYQPLEATRRQAAASVCHARSSDLCSTSQYVVLNDNGLFGGLTARLTQDFSDNDAGTFDAILGANTPDNPNAANAFAFACCGSRRSTGESCPGTLQQTGVCTGTIRDTEDTNFFNAARACAAEGADLCSKSQMQVLRSQGLFFGACWTSDGADNDSSRVGGLLATQPDNPDPDTDLFGYACCY